MGMTKPTRVLVASFPDPEPGNGSGARERIQAGRHTVLLFFHPPTTPLMAGAAGPALGIWQGYGMNGLATAEEAHGHTTLLGQ